MLHPFGVASRDDFSKKTVARNNAGAPTLTGELDNSRAVFGQIAC